LNLGIFKPNFTIFLPGDFKFLDVRSSYKAK
jgi:hypothetical protein